MHLNVAKFTPEPKACRVTKEKKYSDKIVCADEHTGFSKNLQGLILVHYNLTG